ncbi:hypothetical protein J7E63_22475 [Bacillus sp. ISL-75]|nr:hypothetical protein [Bacillus sp. ISL-75]
MIRDNIIAISRGDFSIPLSSQGLKRYQKGFGGIIRGIGGKSARFGGIPTQFGGINPIVGGIQSQFGGIPTQDCELSSPRGSHIPNKDIGLVCFCV